ncbi:MAG: hypothetical protein AAGF11_22180, partial [Myxococcota bacterium]
MSQQTARRWELREEVKTASLLDSLVRNTRGGCTPSTLVERLAERWRRSPQLQIEIRPVQLRVHDLAVGTASKGHRSDLDLQLRRTTPALGETLDQRRRRAPTAGVP